MRYRISYDNGFHDNGFGPAGTPARDRVQRIEYFRTEHEALKRARELLDDGGHDAVVVHDDWGNALAGIRLQLRLGVTADD
jgi:hypothetical protein